MSATGGCHGWPCALYLARERAVDLGHFARFAGHRVAEDRRLDAVRVEKLAPPPRSDACAVAITRFSTRLKTRVAGLGRLGDLAARAALEVLGDRRRRAHVVALEDRRARR